MLINSLIKKVPIIGSCYEFAQTTVKVYNFTASAAAIKTAVRGIILDCSPSQIKYPALCAALATSDMWVCLFSYGRKYICCDSYNFNCLCN